MFEVALLIERHFFALKCNGNTKSMFVAIFRLIKMNKCKFKNVLFDTNLQ